MTPRGMPWPFGAWEADDPLGHILTCLLGACPLCDPSGCVMAPWGMSHHMTPVGMCHEHVTHMALRGMPWPFGAWQANGPSRHVLTMSCLLGACHPHDPSESGHVTSLALTALLGVRHLHFPSDPVLSTPRSGGVASWIWSARRIGANRLSVNRGSCSLGRLPHHNGSSAQGEQCWLF